MPVPKPCRRRTPLAWGGLLAFLAAMIVVDLKVGLGAAAHDRAHRRRLERRSGSRSPSPSGQACGSSRAREAGEAYFAGYVMEKALSLDNVFVFTLIFAALAVPRDEQPRVLLWGILIALVLRAVFIFAGAEALETYSWVAWPFAALLAWTGWRILRSGDEHDEGAKIVERVRTRFPGLKPAVAALSRSRSPTSSSRSTPSRRSWRSPPTRSSSSAPTRSRCSACGRCSSCRRRGRPLPYLQLGLGVLLIAIAAKLVYGELTGDKVPTALTLGVIVGVLTVAIGASLLRERRAAVA